MNKRVEYNLLIHQKKTLIRMRLSSPNVFEDMLIQTPVVVSISPILFFLGRKEVQFNTRQNSKKDGHSTQSKAIILL